MQLVNNRQPVKRGCARRYGSESLIGMSDVAPAQGIMLVNGGVRTLGAVMIEAHVAGGGLADFGDWTAKPQSVIQKYAT